MLPENQLIGWLVSQSVIYLVSHSVLCPKLQCNKLRKVEQKQLICFCEVPHARGAFKFSLCLTKYHPMNRYILFS